MANITLASGIWALIEHCIMQYERERGHKPLALVLHPAHVREFCEGEESDDTLLDGISII